MWLTIIISPPTTAAARLNLSRKFIKIASDSKNQSAPYSIGAIRRRYWLATFIANGHYSQSTPFLPPLFDLDAKGQTTVWWAGREGDGLLQRPIGDNAIHVRAAINAHYG
jgi:hypothetical protein